MLRVLGRAHSVGDMSGSLLTLSLTAVISAEWLSVLVDFLWLPASSQQLNGE